MRRHVLRNAMLPLSTMIAFSMVGLLEGSYFVETLTGVPGIGRLRSSRSAAATTT